MRQRLQSSSFGWLTQSLEDKQRALQMLYTYTADIMFYGESTYHIINEKCIISSLFSIYLSCLT